MTSNTDGSPQQLTPSQFRKMTQSPSKEVLLLDCTLRKMPNNLWRLKNLKSLSTDTPASSTTLSIYRRRWPDNKRLRSPKRKSRKRSKSLLRNTKVKARKLMNKKSKTKSKEQLPQQKPITNSREWTRISRSGPEKNPKSRRSNIKSSIKLFSRNQAILWPGTISRLKVIPISQLCFSCQKDLTLINSISFMRRSLNLSSSSEGSSLMMSSKI